MATKTVLALREWNGISRLEGRVTFLHAFGSRHEVFILDAYRILGGVELDDIHERRVDMIQSRNQTRKSRQQGATILGKTKGRDDDDFARELACTSGIDLQSQGNEG